MSVREALEDGAAIRPTPLVLWPAVSEAIDSKSSAGIKALIDDQLKATAAALGVSTEVAAKTIAAPQQTLDLGDGKYTWKPWRDVAPHHQDVMSARFVEALIPILKQAAPCLILLDEVVAYARNLDGLAYHGFVSFFQSLTEAAKAVPGVLVVGSLPESGPEVGNARTPEASRPGQLPPDSGVDGVLKERC